MTTSTALPLTRLPDSAFIVLETSADLHDALYLALSGVNVGFRIEPGSIMGFVRPIRHTLIRRVSDSDEKVERPIGHLVRCNSDSPHSIAEAVRKLASAKDWEEHLTIDLSGIPAGPRSEAICAALNGVATVLNYRAGRLLSGTDIADLIGHVAPLAPGRLDAQLAWGHREWPFYVKRESSIEGLPSAPAPDCPTYTRTLIFLDTPPRAVLENVLSTVAKSGRPFGLVNGALARSRAEWFKGTSPDKSLLLGNRCYVPTASLDLSGYATMDEQWAAMKRAAGRALNLTKEALPEQLQAGWLEQVMGLRLCGLSITGHGHVANLRDLRNHATAAAFKAADDGQMNRPAILTTIADPVADLADAADLCAIYADHGAACVVPLSRLKVLPVVDWLEANWPRFVGADFKPEPPHY